MLSTESLQKKSFLRSIPSSVFGCHFLKKEAKKISRDDPESFLSCVRSDTYEEVLLEALVIANITDLDTYLSYFDSFFR